MDEKTKDLLHADYEELKFMISGTPLPGPSSTLVGARSVAHFQEKLDHMGELVQSEGISFDRFRLFPTGESPHNVNIADFRIKVMATIGFTRQQFFPEDNPFSGSPATVINMSQTAIQQVHQELMVYLTQQTTLKSRQFAEGSTERKFLDELNESLKTIKSATELVESILNIGSKLGMAIPAILQMLPWK